MFIKLIRLGKDAELNTTTSNKQVLNFSGAYDVGYGDNKRTQWIECAMWGDRGAAIQQYMVKGAQVVIYGDDVELELYAKNDGTGGGKIKCTVNQLDFAGGKNDNSSGSIPAPAPQPTAPQAPTPPPQQPAPAFTETDAMLVARYQQCASAADMNTMWASLTSQQQEVISKALA